MALNINGSTYNYMNSFFKKAKERILLKLDTIRMVRTETFSYQDDTFTYGRLSISEVQDDDLLVSLEEAEQIKKELLSNQKKDSLSTEVSHLTAAVRDLWNLLRARMR